jgi:hypothetical protein
MTTLDYIKSTHPLYAENARLANYLYRSYIGGQLYRDGEYLTKYYGEDEDGQQNLYLKRLNATPLNNYVKTTVDIYRSFLFRELPTRTLGNLYNNPLVQQWIKDVDMEGQGMDSFMKTVNDLAMVSGSVFILIDKPAYRVETQAQEIALGIRPYACVFTPQNVLDWNYHRSINGKRELDYIKYVESSSNHHSHIVEWKLDKICRYTVSHDAEGNMDAIIDVEEYDNPLGYIPIINYAPVPSPNKGIGYSMIEDVADLQRFIYNQYSELEQQIRISGHPTLVKTPETKATAGAGSIVTMPEDLDPGLTPFLLEPNGNQVNSVLDTIEKSIEAIQRMTHTSAVQATKGSPMSGTALQTERQLLNSRLSDMADSLQETETKMWKIWSDWSNIQLPQDFNINYIDTFDIRDTHATAELLRKVHELVPHDAFHEYVHKEVVDLIVEDPQVAQELKATIEMEHAQGAINTEVNE